MSGETTMAKREILKSKIVPADISGDAGAAQVGAFHDTESGEYLVRLYIGAGVVEATTRDINELVSLVFKVANEVNALVLESHDAA